MNNLRSTFSSLREYLTPVSHTSTFKETGEITPEEFVLAGDYLVFKFPTWQWSPCSSTNLEKNFLPKDKQFLVTRKVPSLQRAMSYLDVGGDFEDEEEDNNDEGDEAWAISKRPVTNITPTEPKLTSSDNSKPEEPQNNNEFELNDQDIQDIDDDDFEPVGDLATADMSNKRTYDLFISYSTSYKVPKMYLVGYDSNGIPLTPQQMFEDIASDYRDKTATIEKAPFLENTTSVSIHPCRHATVMKVLMNRAQMASFRKSNKSLVKGVSRLGLKDNENEDANNKEVEEEWESVNDEDTEDVVRVDQYLVIFLKFIASVTPGITHDYTMNAF